VTRLQLILVRHAKPAIERDRPAWEWPLGDPGRSAAARLASVLPPRALLVSSTELKARETADAFVAARRERAEPDPGLAEARRPAAWQVNYREIAGDYVRGHPQPGWEDQAEVARRFQASVDRGLSRADSRPLIIVTHGLAMTLWLSSRGLVGDPGEFWSFLRLPDAWAIRAGRMIRLAA
jgi:2,3-bisphosphoglycerate-dependent phosphoglycerate mutase